MPEEGTLHINIPRYDVVKKIRNMCPDCKKRTYKLVTHQEWYGVDVTCLSCGRNWQDGEWVALDFYRFARRDNISRAKTIWKAWNRRAADDGKD